MRVDGGDDRRTARAQEAPDARGDRGGGDDAVLRPRLRRGDGGRRRAGRRRVREDGLQLLPGQGGPRPARRRGAPCGAHRGDPHAPGRHVDRRGVPGGDARVRRPRRARPGRVDRRRAAARRAEPLAARPALPRLGAGGGHAHAGDRRRDRRGRRRSRPGGGRPHAGLDAPTDLPLRVHAAARRRGPAGGGRRPARAGAPRLRGPRAGPRRLRRRAVPRPRPSPRPRCGAAAASRGRSRGAGSATCPRRAA